jgi:predicted NACHT family NTPase
MDQKIEASGNSTIENVIQVAGNFYFESQRNDLLKSREREIIISRVRMSGIDGVLTPSVKDVGVINLQLEVHHKAFERGELQSIKYVCPPTTTISHATSIDPRFVDKGETIVILGPPGSGKTTVLLRFAAELLDRAQGDAAFPIATVFRLASWRPHQTLEEWLTRNTLGLRENLTWMRWFTFIF